MDVRLRGSWVGMAVVVTLLTGCGIGPHVIGSGQLEAVERQTSDFVALDVEDGIEARVVVDAEQPLSVRLVGDDNLLEKLRTDVEGGRTLHVHFRDSEVGDWSSSNPLRVEVTVPNLESLSRSGGGTVDLSGHITATSFALSASGGGAVRASGLDTGILTLDTSGGTRATLRGTVARVVSEMSGGGTLDARDLSVKEATLSSSGGGSTVMQVSNRLSVSASGGGAVRIIGQPDVASKNLSGGSTLTFE